jgi:hypothetical protein
MGNGLKFPCFCRVVMEGRRLLCRPADGIAGVRVQVAGQENPSGTRPRPDAASPYGEDAPANAVLPRKSSSDNPAETVPKPTQVDKASSLRCARETTLRNSAN